MPFSLSPALPSVGWAAPDLPAALPPPCPPGAPLLQRARGGTMGWSRLPRGSRHVDDGSVDCHGGHVTGFMGLSCKHPGRKPKFLSCPVSRVDNPDHCGKR